MFRMEKDCCGRITNIRLIGRIQSEELVCIRNATNDTTARKILDLSEVTLVDLSVIRFFIGCEDGGIELAQCPAWVGEWVQRERAAGA